MVTDYSRDDDSWIAISAAISFDQYLLGDQLDTHPIIELAERLKRYNVGGCDSDPLVLSHLEKAVILYEAHAIDTTEELAEGIKRMEANLRTAAELPLKEIPGLRSLCIKLTQEFQSLQRSRSGVRNARMVVCDLYD